MARKSTDAEALHHDAVKWLDIRTVEFEMW
jgi:hypothetical protein